MSVAPDPGISKLEQIDALVAALIRDGPSKPHLNVARVIAAHPSLMPELEAKLRTLAAIYAAAGAADDPTTSNPDDEDADGPLRLLRRSVAGYDILCPIHRGGQGVVYKAVQRTTQRLVALKVPLGGAMLSRAERERFEREVALIAELDHPNIVTLYEAGLADGHRWFSMAFIEGVPIDDYVLANGLTPRQVVELFLPILRGLHHAHTRGIIHRDLKPNNILVDHDGVPHIVDFGLAAHLSPPGAAAPRVSLPGAVIGTLPYVSPEQAAGSPAVDFRSDVYSLGVVLFQLLSGTFPYSVEGPSEDLRRRIIEAEPDSVRRAARLFGEADDATGPVPRDLDAIVLKALRKLPAERYASAAALADDLERFLRGAPVEARLGARHYLVYAFWRKHRIAVIVASAVLCGLLLSLGAVTLAWRHAARAARIAQAGLEMAGHLRLGSVARDEGRLTQAMTLFENAAHIGERLDTADRAVQLFLFEAYNRLAQLDRKLGRHEQADRWTELATQVVEASLARAPGDGEWRRYRATALLLAADASFQRGDWSASAEQSRSAFEALGELIRDWPDRPNLAVEQTRALNSLAQCQSMQGEGAAAIATMRRAYDLVAPDAAAETDGIEHRLEAILLLNNVVGLAVAHPTEEAIEQATSSLDAAERWLRPVRASPRAESRRWTIDEAESALARNRRLLEKLVQTHPNTER